MRLSEIKPFVRHVQRLEISQETFYPTYVPCDCRLFFCSGGEGVIYCSGENYPMTKGSVVIIPAGYEYRILPSNSGAQYVSINFDYTSDNNYLKFPIPPMVSEQFSNERIIERCVFSDEVDLNFPRYLHRVHHVENKINKILSAYVKKVIYYELEISGIFCQVILECLRCMKFNALNRRDSVYESVLNYIHENFGEHLTNKKIAEAFGYNQNYMSDLIKISTGIPLHKYLLNVRIERAIEMLEAGGRGVGEIADACGFYDIYHFSKAFKAATGTSPSKYKKGISSQTCEQEASKAE